ncbi:MAG: hypothetical protein C4527_18235 [Candidatus Omnitrophota bacterium]|jgi:hypothetical protein|nr:MAG: hypothetical protein C4527_18235 [Candidatus Omnitrophota bacterium]
MAETFTYDLISFLRVIYLRRYFILKGTFCITVLTALATLIWPETWRAEGRILVSTPKFKEKLLLVPEPFDVLTYQGIMNQDGLFLEVIHSLKWIRNAVHHLLSNPEAMRRMQDNLREKAQTLDKFQLIQNTNLPLLSELLPNDELKEEDRKFLIDTLGHLSDEELAIAHHFDLDRLDDLSVFDLRKMMKTSVAVVKETNLETVYSRMIHVSGEFDTAAGAKMLTNVWIDLFLNRAEQIVREKVEQQIHFKRQQAADLEIALVSAETALTAHRKSAQMESLKAETAAKLVKLTGMAEIRRLDTQKEEYFDLEAENQPFLTERREQSDVTTFQVTSEYEQALIPQKTRLQQEIASFQNLLAKEPNLESAVQKYQMEMKQAEAKLNAVTAQISAISAEIKNAMSLIYDHEMEIAALQRTAQQHKSALLAMRPLLEEAALLENSQGMAKYADVSAFRAIKPDKRIFPKRALMTLVGAAVSFFLFIALAFFMDIWHKVVRPEEKVDFHSESVM